MPGLAASDKPVEFPDVVLPAKNHGNIAWADGAISIAYLATVHHRACILYLGCSGDSEQQLHTLTGTLLSEINPRASPYKHDVLDHVSSNLKDGRV